MRERERATVSARTPGMHAQAEKRTLVLRGGHVVGLGDGPVVQRVGRKVRAVVQQLAQTNLARGVSVNRAIGAMQGKRE